MRVVDCGMHIPERSNHGAGTDAAGTLSIVRVNGCDVDMALDGLNIAGNTVKVRGCIKDPVITSTFMTLNTGAMFEPCQGCEIR